MTQCAATTVEINTRRRPLEFNWAKLVSLGSRDPWGMGMGGGHRRPQLFLTI